MFPLFLKGEIHMDYYIKINRQEIPVTEEVYKTWRHGERKERYFLESDIHNKTFSYDALDTDDLNGCDLFSYSNQEPVDRQVEKQLMIQGLQRAVKSLDEEERELIRRIYFYDESLRHVAASKKIPVTTLQYRHKKILNKMRSIFEHRFLSSDE